MSAHADKETDTHPYKEKMKKIFSVSILIFLTLACSFEQVALLPPPTSSPSPTLTKTYTPIPSATPATPTLTFTSTPTLSGQKTPTPEQSPTVTFTPVISVTPFALLGLNSPTPAPQMDGFVSVLVSRYEFFKGSTCEPSSVEFTVQVADPVKVKYVLLFARFKSMRAERYGKWTSIPMQSVGVGTYIYDLRSSDVLEEVYFQTAWVEYQLVATNQAGREVGRTDIFKEKLAMRECDSTPTP